MKHRTKFAHGTRHRLARCLATITGQMFACNVIGNCNRNGQALVPPQTLYVFTNDPSVFGVSGSGNAPSPLTAVLQSPLVIASGE